MDSKPLCVDDFGSEVYLCHWTGVTVFAQDAIWTGGFYPGVAGRRVTSTLVDWKKARRESYEAFADSDGNCNTCKNLERVKHTKHSLGFLRGKCKATPSPSPLLYTPDAEDEIKFHPDDPMHMPCYESRFG